MEREKPLFEEVIIMRCSRCKKTFNSILDILYETFKIENPKDRKPICNKCFEEINDHSKLHR